MFAKAPSVRVVTAADGSATVYSENVDTGCYRKSVTSRRILPTGRRSRSQCEQTAETLWSESPSNASATRAPRQATHGTDGSASLYAAAERRAGQDPRSLKDRIKIVIAAGGNVKSGTSISCSSKMHELHSTLSPIAAGRVFSLSTQVKAHLRVEIRSIVVTLGIY